MSEDEKMTSYVGPYGRFDLVPKPHMDEPRPEFQSGICTYLINSPAWHPAWSQYSLNLISLADYPDLPKAHMKFPGATHEILLVALNPDHTQTVETYQECMKTGRLPFLKPINIAEQFIATDDEMKELAWLCCRAVVHGKLNPETADAPARIRETWLQACVKTLAHMRGEAHTE